jgi:hypothetical protein
MGAHDPAPLMKAGRLRDAVLYGPPFLAQAARAIERY